jgi:hypothetical protein
MALKLLSKKDEDWFVYRAVQGTCRALIQRIPLGFAQEVEYRHTGRKREMNLRKGTMPWDTEQSAAANQELAVFALKDFEDAQIDITTQALADALGNGAKIGDEVTLDGKLTKAVKEALLHEVPMTRWILEQSATLHTRAKEAEEGEE